MSLVLRILVVAVAGVLLGACADEKNTTPSKAQQTYGAAVDATDAIPAPAVAAEQDRYVGQRVTVDGRIAAVTDEGCTVHLETAGESPLRVEARRTGEAACAWQMPPDANGFVVGAGTLQVTNDSLHLSANGLQETPVQFDGPDS